MLRVLITSEEAEPLASLLRSRGFAPVHLPLRATVALTGPPPCERPGTVLFSSARGVRGLPDPRWIGAARVLCVGPATARAAEARGIPVHRVGAQGGAQLLQLLEGEPEPWVFVGTAEPAPALHAALAEGRVLHWPVYRQVDAAVEQLPEADLVLLESPSAARVWARAGQRAPVLCIGSTTAQAAEAAGLELRAVAARPERAALVEAVARVTGERVTGERATGEGETPI